MGGGGTALRGFIPSRAYMLGLMAAVALASCATPVPPSGGPPDDAGEQTVHPASGVAYPCAYFATYNTPLLLTVAR